MVLCLRLAQCIMMNHAVVKGEDEKEREREQALDQVNLNDCTRLMQTIIAPLYHDVLWSINPLPPPYAPLPLSSMIALVARVAKLVLLLLSCWWISRALDVHLICWTGLGVFKRPVFVGDSFWIGGMDWMSSSDIVTSIEGIQNI